MAAVRRLRPLSQAAGCRLYLDGCDVLVMDAGGQGGDSTCLGCFCHHRWTHACKLVQHIQRNHLHSGVQQVDTAEKRG